jgi:hypothetical protein
MKRARTRKRKTIMKRTTMTADRKATTETAMNLHRHKQLRIERGAPGASFAVHGKP